MISASNRQNGLNLRKAILSLSILTAASCMTACAGVRQTGADESIYNCPVPEPYPENPTLPELVYALNDTYLAWEACSEQLAAMKTQFPAKKD